MTIINVKNKIEAGKIAAKYVLKTLYTKNNAVFGFPTGSSPIEFYKELVSQTKHNNYDWSNIVSFNLDEYYDLDPLFKDQSYHNYMNKHLFSHININKSNIYFPWNPNMKELEIKNYDDLISSFNGLDVTLLGVGVDGHIAFNEPGSEIDSLTRLVTLDITTRKSNARFFKNNINNVPKHAVTMGIKSILNSKMIMLIACGIEKKEAMDHLKQAHQYDPNWPVTALYNHDNLIVLTDLYYNK